MSSVYHILDRIPAIHREETQTEYEELAQQLSASGRMRIDTDYYCNFARFSDPASGVHLMMTIEELTDPNLLGLTRKIIKNSYLQKNRPISDKRVLEIMNELGRQTKKLLPVSQETKLQLARIFVQSAHPVVIRWLLLDRPQVFITYSHNIGDMMDISSWKISGTNSGMQSTDGSNICIYVSCGGDPFAPNNEASPFYGDGWAAVARMQIIAAQEIGHYADIRRDPQGRQTGRHSANFACTRAVPHVREARRSDIKRCHSLYKSFLLWGMEQLLPLEEKLKFYDRQKISGPKIWWLRLAIKYYKYKFMRTALAHHDVFVKRFGNEKYMAILIRAMFADMQANLSPVADVYKRNDPEAEEAVACVEALARVPQQVMKWGYLATRACMHDLYKVYYGEVIPSLIKNYELYTAKKYRRNYAVPRPSLMKMFLKSFGAYRNGGGHRFNAVRDV